MKTHQDVDLILRAADRDHLALRLLAPARNVRIDPWLDFRRDDRRPVPRRPDEMNINMRTRSRHLPLSPQPAEAGFARTDRHFNAGPTPGQRRANAGPRRPHRGPNTFSTGVPYGISVLIRSAPSTRTIC